MRKLKRIIAVALAAMLVLSSAALADNMFGVQPRVDAYFMSCVCKIEIKSGRVYTISISAYATGKMTMLGATSVEIYKNGKYLKTFKYTDDGRTGLMQRNVTSMSDSESTTGVSGASYYAKVHFYAKNSAGTGTKTMTTKTITLS